MFLCPFHHSSQIASKCTIVKPVKLKEKCFFNGLKTVLPFFNIACQTDTDAQTMLFTMKVMIFFFFSSMVSFLTKLMSHERAS